MNRTVRLFAAAGVAALVAACASTPLDEQKTAPVADKSATAPAPAPAPDPRAVAKVDTTPAQPLDPLMDPNNPLSKRSIYFDFDRFDIKSEFTPTVEAHGRYLSSNKNRRIVVEGNADERGSREYNLALGQKRAEAVKSRLMLLGATDTQVDTVSFGEEKPRANGHDEGAWAENRRADVVYK
ncbi:MAG TPA: peptidoglycan-associated lipoprotein Pal [Burkholderiaceae bacterium]|nr:peptidoglycan-associated lipoprotein Pal [Burkholderiaceae bacterium]